MKKKRRKRKKKRKYIEQYEKRSKRKIGRTNARLEEIKVEEDDEERDSISKKDRHSKKKRE